MKNARFAMRSVVFSMSTLLCLMLAGCGGENVVEGGDDTVVSWGFTVTPLAESASQVGTAEKYHASVSNGEHVDIVVARGEQRLPAADVLQTSNGVPIRTVINQPKSAVAVWIVGPPMNTGRYEHTMTECPNGKILVAGGFISGATATNTAEIYDPQTMTWASAGTMLATRARHSATLLPNSNKVLVVGGFPGGNGSQAAEIYDCMTNTWAPAANMIVPRMYQAALGLPDGTILVGSGCCDAAYGTAEVYDPSTGNWAVTPALAIGHAGPTLTFLPTKNNYESLLVGNSNIPTTELYDYKTKLWKTTGSLNSPRNSHSSTWMPAVGKVIVAGGISGAVPSKTTEVYDPITELWAAGTSMVYERYNHTATLISEGGVEDVVWAGGSPAADTLCETYKGKMCPNLNFGRTLHRALAVPHLGKSKVMVTGGLNSGTGASLNSVEFLDLDPLSKLGDPCTLATECASGYCVDGVCCDTACDAGVCDACSVAAGAPSNGMCAPLTGNACNDNNACTLADTCQSGVCTGDNPKTCSASDQCHDAGMCDPATGACSDPAKPDGSACNDNNACTLSDTCQSGMCEGANPTSCSALDECHIVGMCDPQMGNCSNPNAPDGTPCEGGACKDGICEMGSSSTSSSSASSSGGGMGGAGGDGGSAGRGGGSIGNDSGCGCVVVGDTRESGSAMGIALALAALGRRRRK